MKLIYASSRRLRTTEILLGLMTIAWGVAGWMGGGHLNQMMLDRGAAFEWGVLLTVTGFWQVGCAIVDKHIVNENKDNEVFDSARYRSFAALLVGFCWLYVVKELLRSDGLAEIASLKMIAPISVAFCVLIFVENARVRNALDPKFQNSKVRYRR